MAPDFLTLPDRRIAYQRFSAAATGAPGVVFLGGFASDMTGTKASFLAERCHNAGLSFLRFDYRGHGRSDGDFSQAAIGDWYEDVKAVMDRLTTGPQIVIGSSMGGWLGLLLARDRPERIHSLIGIAAAPDFTEDLLWPSLSAEQQRAMQRDGFIDGGHAPLTWRLVEEGRQHLLLRGAIKLACPVRLLQGMQDADVPWRHVLKIIDSLSGADAQLTLIKDGDHRLSRPGDLELLWRVLGEFI